MGTDVHTGCWLMRRSGWSAWDIPDLAGRLAIVTGGNRGLGYEMVRALAGAGASVILAGRSAQRGRAAVDRIGRTPGSVSFLPLDLADLASVRAFVSDFVRRHERLDLLINNAGVMNPPERQETADGFELQFGTNHLGHFALTRGLLPVLSAADSARVVTLSSFVQEHNTLDLEDVNWERRGYSGHRAYGASKIANMLFTLELQRRLELAGDSTIAVASHPGWSDTGLLDTSPFLRLVTPIVAMNPTRGALPTLYAAVSSDVVAGGYYGPTGFRGWRGPPGPVEPALVATDREAARRLWVISEDLVGGEVVVP